MRDVVDYWGSTLEERLRSYPCDDVLPEHERSLFGAVTVDATPAVVFLRGVVGAVLRHPLPAGDLLMMRRQLLNLKALAEATATEPV